MLTFNDEDEALAFWSALAVKSAKERDRLQDRMKTAMEQAGEEHHQVPVGGRKVFQLVMGYSEPAPYIDPDMRDEAMAFLRDQGLTEEVPKKGWEDRFVLRDGTVVNVDTGDTSDAILWDPGHQTGIKRTGFRADTTIDAFERARLLDGQKAALLEGE